MQLREIKETLHLFTVAEYMKLDLPGRTELLGGLIYDVSPKNERHVGAITQLNKALTPALGLGGEMRVRIQDPIAVEGWSGPHAPEIDVAIVVAKKYSQTPTSADSRAFVEVSDTTYSQDKRDKIPLYVSSGVPTWHVNIPARQVDFYPTGADPRTPSRVFSETETIDILGVSIRVADIFDAI